jgi:hypothetical protein
VSAKNTKVKFDIIDIDPFGQPWTALSEWLNQLHWNGILFITNGEAHAVRRNLKNAQRYPTTNYGRRMPYWVRFEYLPQLERLTGLKVRFFYAFPTSIRAILSRKKLPASLWDGCPNWMWWLAKYAPLDCPKGNSALEL